MKLLRSARTTSSRAAHLIAVIKLIVVTSSGLLLNACDSGNDNTASDSSNPIISTPNPDIEGPIDGTPTLLGSTTFNLADVGYQQNEFFITGSARSFTNTTPPASDGKWSVRVVDEADYKTRILVYRPSDSSAFNGTVVIEWLNVSSGTEASSEWVMAHTEMIRKGYAWVGVSAQKAGIDGGGASLAGLPLHLKGWNPTRYNVLVHPGDNYSFDIFSQAAQAVLHPGSIDPLGGLSVQRAIGTGESQSADFMITYINGIAPLADLFDGYMLHSRVHGTAGLTPAVLTSDGIDFSSRATVQVRDDLDVPVMMVQAETDLFLLGSYPDLQPDTSNFRLWEIAGTAHADLYVSLTGSTDLGNDPAIADVVEVSTPNPVISCGKPINAGPQHFVVSAAWAALDNWLRNGVAPASGNPLEVAGNPLAFVKDNSGNVMGGIRTPYVDAPTAMLSGEGQTGTVLCSLFGTTQLFDNTQLASLYPDHATYVSEVNTSVDNAVSSGFLLQPDGDLIKTWAQGSAIGNP